MSLIFIIVDIFNYQPMPSIQNCYKMLHEKNQEASEDKKRIELALEIDLQSLRSLDFVK